jgi:hypothetical protein
MLQSELMGLWNIRWRVVALLGIIALFNAVQCTSLCAAGLCGVEKQVNPSPCHGDSSPDEQSGEVPCAHADLAIGKRHVDLIDDMTAMLPVALADATVASPMVLATFAVPVLSAPISPPPITVLRI